MKKCTFCVLYIFKFILTPALTLENTKIPGSKDFLNFITLTTGTEGYRSISIPENFSMQVFECGQTLSFELLSDADVILTSCEEGCQGLLKRSENVESICIYYGETLKFMSHERAFSMMPNPEPAVKEVANLIALNRWQKIGIISDDNFEQKFRYHVTDDVTDFSSYFKKAIENEVKIFVTMTNDNKFANEMLCQSKQQNAFKNDTKQIYIGFMKYLYWFEDFDSVGACEGFDIDYMDGHLAVDVAVPTDYKLEEMKDLLWQDAFSAAITAFREGQRHKISTKDGMYRFSFPGKSGNVSFNWGYNDRKSSIYWVKAHRFHAGNESFSRFALNQRFQPENSRFCQLMHQNAPGCGMDLHSEIFFLLFALVAFATA